jgi:hypothetical protein
MLKVKRDLIECFVGDCKYLKRVAERRTRATIERRFGPGEENGGTYQSEIVKRMQLGKARH